MARPPKKIDPEFLKKVMRTYPSLIDAAALCDCGVILARWEKYTGKVAE